MSNGLNCWVNEIYLSIRLTLTGESKVASIASAGVAGRQPPRPFTVLGGGFYRRTGADAVNRHLRGPQRALSGSGVASLLLVVVSDLVEIVGGKDG